jgi:Uma2 family endonuclease
MSLELAADGRLLTRRSVGSWVSRLNFQITSRPGEWVEAAGAGVGFANRTGFALPNGAIYAPALSWVRRERWEALTQEQQEDFAPLCPDFVLEYLISEYDLKTLRAKMREYRDCGTQLGWLFNMLRSRVEIYRPGQRTETVDRPTMLSGEDVLPGFVLDLTRIWT